MYLLPCAVNRHNKDRLIAPQLGPFHKKARIAGRTGVFREFSG
jgi:hypothetical protein